MRRQRLAFGFAIAACITALVGAYGPAERLKTTYSWPPPTIPDEQPSALWYTPLLLAAHRPESIEASIPCQLPDDLPSASGPTIVLATARHPRTGGALAITRSGGKLTVAVGEEILWSGRLGSGPRLSDCAFELRIDDKSWSLAGGPRRSRSQGALTAAPGVSGVFTSLDLGDERTPSIDITTVPHASPPTARQSLAWTISALALVLALLVISIERRPSLRQLASNLRRGASHAHIADAAVGVTLVAWLVFAPIGFDDGWVQAREQMFRSAGGFSHYYNVLGTNLPLDYWLEWAHHWVAEATNAIVLLRIPALMCLAGMWVICRWSVASITPSAARHDSIVVWALACGFLVGALAWGMTLRAEPVTALLFTAVTACMLRFLESQTVGTLAAVAVLIPLALTAHTTGVVALAPVIVGAPQIVRWARKHAWVAATIVTSGGALLTVLATVGSDVEQRSHEVQLSQKYSLPVTDELARYSFLTYEPTSAPIRRMAVGMLVLSIAAFVLRRRRQPIRPIDFPAPVLGVALLLLIATPSKWAWHFGAFIGIGAIAVAAETARLRIEGQRASRWQVWPFLAIAAGAAVGSWSWWTTGHWNAVDLRVTDWDPRVGRVLAELAVILPVYALAVAAGVAWSHGHRGMLPVIPWRVASWTALLVSIPAFAFTLSILVVDTARSNDWTLGRQNISTINGIQGCGLADDILVAASGSTKPLSSRASETGSAPDWVPASPVAGLGRYALSPVAGGSSASPWFEVRSDQRFGLFVAGTEAPDDLALEWGRRTKGRIAPLERNVLPQVPPAPSGTAPWKFLAAGELPRNHPRADHLRVVFRARDVPGPALAVTAPVSYRNESLARLMEPPGARSLVYPELLPYFPCTTLPELRNGRVEVPELVVSTDNHFAVPRRDPSSPFLGLLDLYEFERVPIADTEEWPERVLVFRISQEIPGSKALPPDQLTLKR